MDANLSNGTNDFNSSGAPLSSPSFTWTGGSSTGLPNQNDDYTVTDAVVTSMKYDLLDGTYDLILKADGTFTLTQDSEEVGSGTYAVAAVPEPSSLALIIGVLSISGVLYRRSRS